jgi:alpha/beta superfamily hydrolase
MLMRNIKVFVLFLISINIVKSQQWVNFQYQYDSLMNVPYGNAIDFNGDSKTLTMDIYQPTCSANENPSNRPLLLWIHGGAFLAGSKDDQSIQTLCKNFAKRGYVTATINYRLGFVSDDRAWNCAYPNYNCVFATDSIEWARAYYRAVQDAKGAIRYLVNRHQLYHIDLDNIFVAGESAGAFVALGAGLMDMESERPIQTFAQPAALKPNANSFSCIYNTGKTFSNPIQRPDLGTIEGSIEPTTLNFTIKGIGNMYGAMLGDLLKSIPLGKKKPVIYSFHQPCDLVVPIDSSFVYSGLSWCFTNGYNCFGITNNQIKLYGARAFSQWNTKNNFGYTLKNEFTTINFPYSFIFGERSCLDQVQNPCHAYDNFSLRDKNLAQFFASQISNLRTCSTSTSTYDIEPQFTTYPNPVYDYINIRNNFNKNNAQYKIYDIMGRLVMTGDLPESLQIDISILNTGVYFLQLNDLFSDRLKLKIVKI